MGNIAGMGNSAQTTLPLLYTFWSIPGQTSSTGTLSRGAWGGTVVLVSGKSALDLPWTLGVAPSWELSFGMLSAG